MEQRGAAVTSPLQTVSATTGASTRLLPRRVLADLPTLTPRPVPSLSVMAGVFWGVTAVAAITYWPQISHAAFFRDDWTFAYHRLTHPHHYLLFGLHNAVTHNRPVYVLVNNWLSALFGNDATALLLVGLVVDGPAPRGGGSTR